MHSTPPMITVRDLQKKFGEFSAVKGVSFDVQKGEIFAFLGPNGAGKTTTIKMLTTLLEPTSGSIQIAGFDPSHDAGAVRKQVGIVFQDPSLDDELTAWENLELHGVLYGMQKRTRRSRMEELLEMVGLTDRANDRVSHFSGGMKRRLEIARGLLHHPAVLFLDEPTLGLDPQTRNHLWTYVQQLNAAEQVTVFLTTHYMDEAERTAMRIAVIDHGTIVALDSPKALMEKTATESLEDAFLALTGNTIREESVTAADSMRMRRRMWSGRKR